HLDSHFLPSRPSPAPSPAGKFPSGSSRLLRAIHRQVAARVLPMQWGERPGAQADVPRTAGGIDDR
ncbi:unnamed protein product, partial [Mycena citricolor]